MEDAMKKILLIYLLTLFFALGNAGLLMAQQATEEEALAVATSWISAIIAKYGEWGGAKSASVKSITPFSRRGNQVGYFCMVHPQGYIIISLRKEMAPVKAYSATGTLDPKSEEGMADLLKGNMERILLKIARTEQQHTSSPGTTASLGDLLEIDYQPAWKSLASGDLKAIMTIPQQAEEQQLPEQAEMEDGAPVILPLNYQEGEVLLTSDWHQFAPYNNNCPDYGCATTSNGRALVGCVATAGAQLAHYWNWPPYGEGSFAGVDYSDTYDWVNMPDVATTSSTAKVQAGVAELSYEMGIASVMMYGCEESSTYTSNLETVLENLYRYSSTFNVNGASRKNRSDYTASFWFDIMKNEFNYNRPVIYRITGHAIVGDGWQTIGAINEYHMNYGWYGPGSDTWYTLDAMTDDPEGQEYLINNIIPSPYLLSLSGTYPRESFPYRYFYKDTI